MTGKELPCFQKKKKNQKREGAKGGKDSKKKNTTTEEEKMKRGNQDAVDSGGGCVHKRGFDKREPTSARKGKGVREGRCYIGEARI